MAAFRTAWASAALLLTTGCGEVGSPPVEAVEVTAEDSVRDSRAEARKRLRDRENAFLQDADPSSQPPWSASAGPDPHLVAGREDGFAGLLRGASALVALDASGQERSRTPAPEGAVAWSWPTDEEVWVVGERSATVQSFRFSHGRWEPSQRWVVDGVTGLRGIAVSGDQIYVADRHRGRVLRLEPAGAETLTITASAPCAGAVSVDLVDGVVIANCLLAHRVRFWPLSDPAGIEGASVVVQHDGPIWAAAARTGGKPGQLSVAVAGVEDHPLDRSRGGFGYIDSFVEVYAVSASEGTAVRRWSQNVGELGVVTPKSVAWEGERLLVSGAGGHTLALLDPLGGSAPRVRDVPWGLTSVAGTFDVALAADPLLDAWVRLDAPGPNADAQEPRWHTLAVAPGPHGRGPSDEARLGEALVFTSMLAPQGRTEAYASRFTCETCHFEGTVDGRTHSTGRGEVHATTKTLRGLVGNRPHFSRALDRNSMDMIHNEFRVANHGTSQSPWFSIDPADTPWFLWPNMERRSPEALRGAVFSFLATLAPEQNPAVQDRARFSEAERSGAKLFAEHCASCHAPLRQADDPDSGVESGAWERAVMQGPRLLWGSAARVDVGVEPAVHEDGARTPSLRNLWAKRPYFTNGSASSLAEVLRQVSLEPSFSHQGATVPGLSRQERDDLERFIDLL